MSEEFSNRIKALREARSWSLRQLATKCGVHFNTLSKLENGVTQLDVARMRQIAGAFGLPASALLNDEDVECRLNETTQDVISLAKSVPEEARPALIRAAKDVLQISGALASRSSAGALEGSSDQLSELTRLWNHFDPESRQRALNMLTLMQPATKD